jgi:hypothetical protein
MAQSELCFSGAAVVGGVRTSLPTTTLTVTQELIILRLFPFGVYYFSPKNVISIEQVNKTRICIRHAIRDYPSKISFISIDSKDIAQRIKEMGFAPSCRGLDSLFSIPRSGSPVYWQVILGSLLWWNGLLFLGSKYPGLNSLVPLPLVALFGIFLACLLILNLPMAQRFVLKPGRRIGEIKPALFLTVLITGLFLVVMSLAWIVESINHQMSTT